MFRTRRLSQTLQATMAKKIQRSQARNLPPTANKGHARQAIRQGLQGEEKIALPFVQLGHFLQYCARDCIGARRPGKGLVDESYHRHKGLPFCTYTESGHPVSLQTVVDISN